MADIHSYEPIFGAWYIEGLLGKGSYGSVYRAWRSEYGNTFYSAIKHISIEDTEDFSAEQQAQALSREININYQLRGETHFVSFEDSTFLNKPDGSGVDVFIRMELLTSLTQRMKQNPLDEREVVRLGMEICEALEGLEKRGIIHRDIKPANIFVSDTGAYKLGDFGVARSFSATMSSATIAGTPNYMAPEIYRGGQVNHTADIYSLGMVLYRLLNGDRGPFLPLPPETQTFEDANAALSRRMNGEPLPPPACASSQVAEVILLACAYDPEQRWQSARAFSDALRAALEPAAPPDPYPPGPAPNPGRRKAALIGGAAAAVLAILLIIRIAGSGTGGDAEASPTPTIAPPVETAASPSSAPTEGPAITTPVWTEDVQEPEPTPAADFDTQIELIRTWFSAAQDRSALYDIEYYGDTVTAYWYGGIMEQLVADAWTNASGSSGYHYRYFYQDDGTPYFAFVSAFGQESGQLRLYFWDGKIIRWIESDGVVHDSESPGYQWIYEDALSQYRNAVTYHNAGYSAPAPTPAAQPASGFDYRGALGSSFYVPAGFEINQESYSNGGSYDYLFYNPSLDFWIDVEEYSSVSYARSDVESASQLLEGLYTYYSSYENVTFLTRGDDWFVVSGYESGGEAVYYFRFTVREPYIYDYTITYPSANKDVCDQIVGDFAASYHLD